MINQQLEDKIQSIFSRLSLKEKLVVFAKFKYSTVLRFDKKEPFNLDRKEANAIYENFLQEIRKK